MKATYHIVSHSHWDREWYFPFDRFRAMLVDMMEDLFELFEKDPDFRSYTLDGQMAAVQDYLEIRPDRKDLIRKLVREKKLFIGPWYILNDEFLASGESHVRNLLLGFRYGKDLGGVMPIGYIPDQFGHIAQMPQILLGFGINTAMIYRGFGGEPGQEPSEYWWIAPDGSRVLLHHLPKDGYSAGYFASTDQEVIVQKFDRIKKELDARASTSHRLFFNGGDHHWPDDTVTRAIKVLEKKYDARFLHSNFVDYFSDLKKELNGRHDLPTLCGESRFGYRHALNVLGGVFSSRIYLKQMNADREVMLERYVEPLNALASVDGMRSKQPQIEQAWKYVLQNQDHDAICGTSVDEVHQEMVVRYNKAKQIGEHVLSECFATLLPYDERAHKDERYLFVFNPSPFPRSELIQAEVDFYRQDVVVGLNPEVTVTDKLPPIPAFKLLDEKGAEVPIQVLKKNEAFGLTYSKHDYPHQTLVDRFTALVEANDLPPMGWKAYHIEKTNTVGEYASRVSCGERSVENEFLKLEVNSDGSFQLLDKTAGLKYGPLNSFEDSGDVGDEYDYSYPERDEWISSKQFPATVKMIERGPLRGSIEIHHQLQVPETAAEDERSRSSRKVALDIVTVISLGAKDRRVDIKTIVHNAAKDHRLRALFATGMKTEKSFAGTPFAVVERHHREYDSSQFPFEHPAMVAPMQRFVTIQDEKKGLTLITKGLPEYELKLRDPGVLALTLLRCVGKLSGRNLITRPGGAAGWWNETPEAQCPGTHIFEYSLYPHSSQSTAKWADILREVERFVVPPLAIKRKNEHTKLSKSFFSFSSEHLQLSALKEAEDGNGFIARFCNLLGEDADGLLHFERSIRHAAEVGLNEQEVRQVVINDEHSLKIQVGPFKIVSIKIQPT